MRIGAPKTRKSLIGTFELRVGPLSKAGNLTSDHSVGIVDQVKLDITFDTVDLMAGFPQKPVETAVTKYISGFTATLREYSSRNLNLVLGNSYADYAIYTDDDVSGYIDTSSAITSATTSLNITQQYGTFTGLLNPGDLLAIYDVNNPSKVSIVKVVTYNTFNSTITISPNTPLLKQVNDTNVFNVNTLVKLYKLTNTWTTNSTGTTNYYSAQLIRTDRATGATIGFDFWKTSITSGLSSNASISEFASLDMDLRAHEPIMSDYAVGGIMAHLGSIIPANPVFKVFDVSDVAGSKGVSVVIPPPPSTGNILTSSDGLNFVTKDGFTLYTA